MARKMTARIAHEFDEGLFDTKSKRSSKQRYPQAVKSTPAESLTFKTKFAPRTEGQRAYLRHLNDCTITFCFGPAGCGKSWMAARVALENLINNTVDRIIVTKPIIEAGDEALGWLPGEANEKTLPYFQSLLDCFEDHIGPTATKKLVDTGKIVFLPTAYCRGRNLKNAFILIDEAQNLTRNGIKLLMTRLAEGSKMVINGDPRQIDLPVPSKSGLEWAATALNNTSSDIGLAVLTKADNQRHPLIDVILTHLEC